jgi:signal transduction histidine kinase
VRKDQDLDVVIARLAAAIRTTTPAAGETACGPRKILAIADDPVVATLREDGYDVVLARSHDQVFERLAVEPVDCILLDQDAGLELCRQLKAAPIVRDVPLVLLAPRDDRGATLEALGAGADDCVARTSEPAVIRARIRAQVRRKQFEDETRHIRERLLRTEFEASEARAARELAEARAALAGELQRKNQELEAFSYSVSHDLRAPLRSIGGFAAALVEDYGSGLDAQANDYLRRITTSIDRMSTLIDDLLELARVTKVDLARTHIDLAAIARTVVAGLRERHPARRVEVTIDDRIMVDADPGLLRAVLENLLGNAWKFTARRELATIAFHRSGHVISVRDNGVGFEPSRAEVLFRPFHRLHTSAQFEGSGVGLATVHRIVSRHGGRVWIEGAPDRGATVFFTLRPEDS